MFGRIKILLAILLLAGQCQATHLVLVGATGSLAQKYLWHGLGSVAQNVGMDIFAAARASKENAEPTVMKYIHEIPCKGLEDCEDARKYLEANTQYVQLRDEYNYEDFCQNTLIQDGRDRIFYLSIPPFSYAKTIESINKHCRPSSGKLKVAIEKPFGSDATTARSMLTDIDKYLKDEELFLVDHYLGKPGVDQILQFKMANPQLFGTEFVGAKLRRVQIVSSETEDVRGRTRFYDHYGVIRDMMQNHMMEMFMRVAAEVPSQNSAKEVQTSHQLLLQDVPPFSPKNIVLGQYQTYLSHVRSDFGDKAKTTLTPTFAAAVGFVQNKRWQGVPFIFASGKQLGRKRTHIDFLFHKSDSEVCMDNACEDRKIIFNIQGGTLNRPYVKIIGNFKNLAVPEGWSIHGHEDDDYKLLEPPFQDSDWNSYTKILSHLIESEQQYFVQKSNLMQSWKIWQPALVKSKTTRPQVYQAGGGKMKLRYDDKARTLSLASQDKLKQKSNKPRHAEL